MSQPETREVEHDIVVDAPAEVVYRFLADVGNWPQLFPPTVHVEYVERGGTQERIQIWATANGEAKTWHSHRALDPENLRIVFRQAVSAPPVASMGGAWVVEPDGPGRARVRLLHDYRAIDDDSEALGWIDQAVDRNSRSELAALKRNAELAAGASELLLTFEDSTQIAGTVADVYDFVDQAQLWEERLPHVAKVRLEVPAPGLQLLEMDTRTKDGSVHTTRSVRVCLAPDRIVYKQTQVPALMTLHTGQWRFEKNDNGVLATSRHTVMINEANIAKVLGADATVGDARAFVRNALGTNSLATLAHAKDYAEGHGGC